MLPRTNIASLVPVNVPSEIRNSIHRASHSQQKLHLRHSTGCLLSALNCEACPVVTPYSSAEGHDSDCPRLSGSYQKSAHGQLRKVLQVDDIGQACLQEENN
ncbi:hypothetical protein chiPu_0003821 [Chiloscyllium punctatum]|uniref:Uncharacterized protein n=1 Tax=Chiloscyllium punctatum TaxID=137246 RepID=A0A401S4U0_CHIPU|nr:hypothetical protein [Chiloscyllium punctatum]